jgi:hypothetical protein
MHVCIFDAHGNLHLILSQWQSELFSVGNRLLQDLHGSVEGTAWRIMLLLLP